MSGPPWLSWRVAGMVLGAAIAGAAIGKVSGFVLAQVRLARTIREITVEMRSRKPKVVDQSLCG